MLLHSEHPLWPQIMALLSLSCAWALHRAPRAVWGELCSAGAQDSLVHTNIPPLAGVPVHVFIQHFPNVLQTPCVCPGCTLNTWQLILLGAFPFLGLARVTEHPQGSATGTSPAPAQVWVSHPWGLRQKGSPCLWEGSGAAGT